jgi:predicted Zn-dependent protease
MSKGLLIMFSHRMCLFMIVILWLATGCRSTPITGRRQMLFVPEATEISMGISAYQQTLESEPLSTNQRHVELIRRVGQRIAEVANRPDYQWEFQLIAAPQMNAFCLPGGKVAIYEGILPVCQNEAGVAVVMAHEIAHALARHGGERMSHEYVVSGVGKALEWATLNRASAPTREKILKAYGISSKYGFVLPYSRKHESEADHMGTVLMARAGYDPREAARFWERFGNAQDNGEQPIEFLSTHPNDMRRALELRQLLPEILPIYEQATERFGLGDDFSADFVAQAPQAVPN